MKINLNFATLLTVLFIGLKLTNYITWSWLWVLSPIWISALLAILFLVVFVALKLWLEK